MTSSTRFDCLASMTSSRGNRESAMETKAALGPGLQSAGLMGTSRRLIQGGCRSVSILLRQPQHRAESVQSVDPSWLAEKYVACREQGCRRRVLRDQRVVSPQAELPCCSGWTASPQIPRHPRLRFEHRRSPDPAARTGDLMTRLAANGFEAVSRRVSAKTTRRVAR